MSPADYPAAPAVMMLWGLNFPMAKLGLSEFPPLLFMAVRFIVVAALLRPWAPLPRDKLRGVLALAVLPGSVHFSPMFSGIARIDAATASILLQTQVPFAALLAAIFYRDRLRWRRFSGMVVAFLGTPLIAGEPRFGKDPAPLSVILGVAFAWALANIQIKRIGAINGFALSGWLALFAAPQRLGLWYPLVRRYPVNQTMPFTLLVPVLGVAFSALMLGGRLSWQAATGGVATILGVALIVLARPLAAARPR